VEAQAWSKSIATFSSNSSNNIISSCSQPIKVLTVFSWQLTHSGEEQQSVATALAERA
jgi:hypothetical protein